MPPLPVIPIPVPGLDGGAEGGAEGGPEAGLEVPGNGGESVDLGSPAVVVGESVEPRLGDASREGTAEPGSGGGEKLPIPITLLE